MKTSALNVSFICCFLFCLISGLAYSQTDTVWYSSNGKSPIKKDSLFYSFKDGVQIINGKISLNSNQYYTNGQLRKEILTPNATLSFNFRTLKTKYYDINGLSRMEVENRLGEVWNIEKVYFNEKGQEVGRSYKQKDGTRRGKDVKYYFDDVLTVKEITETTDSKTVKTLFYKSGKVARKIIENKTEKQETAYNEQGEQIGGLTYVKNKRWEIVEGKKILFGTYDPFIEGFEVYKNKKVVEVRRFQEEYPSFPGLHSMVKGDITYTYYDFNGVILDTLIEVNGKRNGTEYIKSPDQIKTYNNNVVIAYTTYFTFWGKQIKKVFKNNTITYYNKIGDKLGTLTQSKNGRPLKGSKFTYYYTNDVELQTDYKDGDIIRIERFNYHQNTKKQYTSYLMEGDRISRYFFNGKTMFTLLGKSGRINYSPQGDTLPSYDQTYRGDVYYQYFLPPYDHLLKSKMVKRDGKIVYLKAWFKPEKTINIQDSCTVHYIYKDTGVNYVYNEKGVEIDKIARRNGQIDLNEHDIFETIIKYPKANSIDITYENGIVKTDVIVPNFIGGKKHYVSNKTDDRNGPFKIYDHYSGRLSEEGTYKYHKLEGEYITYYKNGRLKQKAQYAYGKLHGEKIFYDINGGTSYKLKYKNGYPYAGYYPNNRTGLLEVYNSGIHINTIGLKVYDVSNPQRLTESQSLILINPDTQNKYADLVIKNETIEGVITYYNPKGKRIYKGLFKDGVLKEGDVFFEIYENMGISNKRTSFFDNKPIYYLVHLNCKEGTYTLTFYDEQSTIKNKVMLKDYPKVIELIKNKTKEESVYNKDTKGHEYNEFKNLVLSKQSLDILFNPKKTIKF